jgi:hypothetical protein
MLAALQVKRNPCWSEALIVVSRLCFAPWRVREWDHVSLPPHRLQADLSQGRSMDAQLGTRICRPPTRLSVAFFNPFWSRRQGFAWDNQGKDQA